MAARYILILKLLCLFLVFSLAACASALKPQKSYSKNGLTIQFRSINALDDVQGIQFQYPIILSQKNIRNHLLSLYYQKIINPRGPKPVFSRAAVAEIAPILKTVIRKVKPGKFLHFEYHGPKGATEGRVFATAKKKIHWRLFKINGIAYSNDPLRLRKPTWRLIRMPGLSYQKLNRDGGFKKYVKNRLVANFNLPFPKHRDRSRYRKRPPPNK